MRVGITRKDNYFKEAIEHLYSLKLKEDLPEFWQVPLRNYNFVGREALLDKIEECLKANDTATLVACHGIGGIGKTQLALEFIWSKLQKYRWIIWLDTRDIALFTIIRTDRNMLLACYSHKHISYRIRTIIRKAILYKKIFYSF